MHLKNPFAKDYDFDKLVQHYSDLSKFVFVNQYGNKTIKFADPKAVKALNAALLKTHYNIIWDIPPSNLCPPIPGRLDYLLYVADLTPTKKVRMLDIGTGASLIYPILGAVHFNWHCTASEVSMDSLKNAQILIHKNKLKNIKLRHQVSSNKIFENIIQPNDVFDVVVCNPPFYKSKKDAQANNQRKVRNLKLQNERKLNFGGQSNELWYKGGEEAFIKKMVVESVAFKNHVHWFTALVSKKDHLKSIKKTINKILPITVKVVNMGQGNKQSRFVAWTFH